jgi:UPF0755 protein
MVTKDEYMTEESNSRPEDTQDLSSQLLRRSALREETPEVKKRSVAKIVVAVIALVALTISVIGGLFLSGLFAPPSNDYQGGGEGEVIFTVNEGEYGDAIAANLVDAGVTKSFDAFYELLLETQPEPVFIPGVYLLKEKMSAQAALDALLDQNNRVELKTTIPEGTTLNGALAILSEDLALPLADLEAAASNPASYGVPAEATTLEGFLFPATYVFSPGVSATDVITRLVNQMLATLDEVGVPVEERWDVIRLASVIQRESGPNPEDMYKISRVFTNRLEQGMNMGSDVTTCYGAGLVGRDCLLITQAALDDTSNLYNTRILPGLPIGPISNPGKVAIEAAYRPTEGPWLFFVTVNLTTGETIFTETNAEHEEAVKLYQQWLIDNPNSY